jgi:hypothetical protein
MHMLLQQNDSIIDMISNTPGPELAPARDLIKRWRHRKLYKCVFVIDIRQQCMDLKQISNEIVAVSAAMVHSGDTITCNLSSSTTAATAAAGVAADTAHRHKRARAQPTTAAATAATNGSKDSDTEPDSDDDVAADKTTDNSTDGGVLNGQQHSNSSSSTSRMQSITEGNEDATTPDRTGLLHSVNGGSSTSTNCTSVSGPLTNGVLHSSIASGSNSSSSSSVHQQQQQQQQQLGEAAVPVARFTAADFVCEICDMHCGQHADNPTANMRFYNKFDRGDEDSAQTPLGIAVQEDWYVGTLPKELYQRQLRVFVKDVAKADALAHVLEAWHQQHHQKPSEQLDDE